MLTAANTTSFMNFDSELIRLPPYVVISVLLICEGEVSPHFIQLIQQFFFLAIFKGIQVAGSVFALLQGDDGITSLILELFLVGIIGQG